MPFSTLTPGARRTHRDLVVVTQDPRFGGGALAQLEAFLNAAEAMGRSSTLVYRRRHPLPDPSPLAGVPALEGRSLLSRVDALGVPLVAGRAASDVREAESVWVVATIAFYGLAALRSRRPYGCWIGTTYDSEQEGRRTGLDPLRRLSVRMNAPALRRWEREVMAGATVLLAPADQIADELAARSGVDRSRIGVLPIPIDTQRFFPLSDAEWIRRPPRLVFVGRADDPRKNVRLLLDAFRLARVRMPELRLRLVGRPPAEQLPDGVEAVGEVRDVASHLRDARLLVLPSVQEGFGIAAAEALACGVPVVTTPCGGPEETIRRSGAGRVLGGFDPEEMAHVTLDLVEDEQTLVSMRTAGRRHVVDCFGVDRVRASLDAAMHELGLAA